MMAIYGLFLCVIASSLYAFGNDMPENLFYALVIIGNTYIAVGVSKK